jgi:hypothetical protein
MDELGFGGGELAKSGESLEGSLPGEPTQADDHPNLGESLKFLDQKRETGVPFVRGRTVVGRSAANDGRDVSIPQAKSVVTGRGGRLVCKAALEKGAIKPIPRSIPRKESSRSIGAMCSRSKTQNKHSGGKVSESWNRAPPISLILEFTPFGEGDILAPSNQTRALPTSDDSIGKALCGFRSGCSYFWIPKRRRRPKTGS